MGIADNQWNDYTSYTNEQINHLDVGESISYRIVKTSANSATQINVQTGDAINIRKKESDDSAADTAHVPIKTESVMEPAKPRPVWTQPNASSKKNGYNLRESTARPRNNNYFVQLTDADKEQELEQDL